MSKSSRSALRRLGWGLLFPLLDFHIIFFDIFPDFIGYIMIASALSQLGREHIGFKKAGWVAFALTFLSLPQVLLKTSIDVNEFSSSILGLHIYIQATAALHALMAYWIFSGLAAMAREEKQQVLLGAVMTRRNLYLFVSISQLFFFPFLINLEDSWVMLLMGIGILSFIMEILLIRLPFRLSKSF